MYKDIQVAPSILNADFLNLESELSKIQSADWVHFDVMDGHFVPNLTFGPPVVRCITEHLQIPAEAHLMVNCPENIIPMFFYTGVSRIIIHAETTPHLHRLVQSIKEKGLGAGVALNPATPIGCLDLVLPELEMVLLMTVNPGFGGQELIPGVLKKIENLRRIIDRENLSCRIGVDGGVNEDTAPRIVSAGADFLVAGTFIIKNPEPAKVIKLLNNIRGGTTR